MSALPEEQAGLAANLENPSVHVYAGREFYVGRWNGQPVVFVLSRIGKVAAATTAAAVIERFGATRLYFTGVAGGLHPRVKVGDTVVATELLQHDIDASPLFPRHEVPLYGRSRFAADMAGVAQLTLAAQAVTEAGAIDDDVRQRFGLGAAPCVHQGLLVSGDRFVSRASESQALREALPDALAVDMEAAAVAQVCHDHGVPFAAVRHISDRADDSAHVDFPAYLAQVAALQARALISALLDRHAPA
nr:5'-methylthioadenosine/adenosylhomocysteine nucleosidase [Variovorax dokdonensis]